VKLSSDQFKDGGEIPSECAFGKSHPETHIELSQNRNPHLEWSDLPVGTRSLCLVCVDADAPSQPDDVNQEGVTVPHDLPRADFYHWALADLPADSSPIREAEFSNGITAGGKPAGEGPRGTRAGLNDYTMWFTDDPEMAGQYYGYDGPCPPWNDERIHHYRFTLYALDMERCPVVGEFRAPDLLTAIGPHVLGEASITGTYAIYPKAR
jgi:hypothetical protein